MPARSTRPIFPTSSPASSTGGPRTHIVSDLTYVRVGARWHYICLLIDLYNREIVGHAAGERKDARLVKSAFATVPFPLTDIQVFHTDRGGEFDDIAIDGLLEAFGIEQAAVEEGMPLRQRGGRVRERGAEGRVRLQGEPLVAARAAGQAERLRPLVQPLQAALQARLHEPGRIQGGRPQSLRKMSK